MGIFSILTKFHFATEEIYKIQQLKLQEEKNKA